MQSVAAIIEQGLVPQRNEAPASDAACAGRILVVDDMFDNRSVLKRRLVKRGFHVVEAESGPEALDLIASQAFDLVLLDVMMPGMSGLEVLEQVRQSRSSQSLPIIMVTAKSFSDDVVAALQLGADDYVTKPVDFGIALARINTQIARKRAAEAIVVRAERQAFELVEAQQQITLEIEEKQKSEAAVSFLANHDALTGLANRNLFNRQLDNAAAEYRLGGEAMSLLFIDLDRFKAVNDSLGHLVGDKLLKGAASRIASFVVGRDVLARFGGDEFLILHRHAAGSTSAEDLANGIVQAFLEPFAPAGQDLILGVSVGIAPYLDPDSSPEALIGDADVAMYAAKKSGGNRVRSFDRTLADDARRRTELELELQSALKRSELRVLYQPIIALESGAIAAFEALLRWEHPQRGTISPAEFIPIAEETGLIVQIGDWVLREACREAMLWPDHIKVAVNLSSVQFERGNLVASVMNALAAFGLPPARLELEITESLLLVQSNQNLLTLRQLRELGVRIAMDDFGTGYSSLSYLLDFEFDKIKLDQSFVRSLANDDGSRAIVASISNLARNLGITTTAEGVETVEQLDFIRANGMTEVQGFYLGRPMTSASIAGSLDALAESSSRRPVV